ncbi:MAG TPA: tRNA adenosine(34) deaminase TadA [Longimicrobiales bacterium]|nr:tRNA adenosine(34) deaminase TadA [Longimicrobiales bacterium]
MTDRQDDAWMARALEQARAARTEDEVPIGAVVVQGGRLIAEARNRTRTWHDPTGHAEVIALRRAASIIGDWRLTETTLYVTLEPCAMCAGAMVLARVKRVVYGTPDPKAGMCGSLGNLVQDPRLNHRAELTGGVLEQPCGDILREFFRARRQKPTALAADAAAFFRVRR